MGSYEYYLAHHGIKGQKWGIRRYQNEDGTLTPEGRARYLDSNGEEKGLTIGKRLEMKLNKAISNRNEKKAKEEARIKETAKKYSEAMAKANELSAQSDAVWEEAYATYKSLGKNFIQRYKSVSAAQKGGGSKEAKEYLKKYDKMSDLADASIPYYWEAEDLYNQLGKTKWSRIRNATKYV